MSIYSTLIGEDLKTKMEDECKLYSGEFDIAAGSMALPRGPFRERERERRADVGQIGP